jgi:hypothetical protein
MSGEDLDSIIQAFIKEYFPSKSMDLAEQRFIWEIWPDEGKEHFIASLGPPEPPVPARELFFQRQDQLLRERNMYLGPKDFRKPVMKFPISFLNNELEYEDGDSPDDIVGDEIKEGILLIFDSEELEWVYKFYDEDDEEGFYRAGGFNSGFKSVEYMDSLNYMLEVVGDLWIEGPEQGCELVMTGECRDDGSEVIDYEKSDLWIGLGAAHFIGFAWIPLENLPPEFEPEFGLHTVSRFVDWICMIGWPYYWDEYYRVWE